MPQDHPGRPALSWTLFLLLPALLMLLWTGAPGTVLADDEAELTPEEEERLDAIDRHTERGWRAFRRGNHDEVLARMKRLRRYDENSALADYLTARVLERTGKYTEALETVVAATKRHSKDAELRAVHLRLLGTLGRTDEMEAAARAALAKDEGDLVALAGLGMALEERGKREEALAAYDKIVNAYNKAIRAGASVPRSAVPIVAHAGERATWLSPNSADDLLTPVLRMMRRYENEHPDDQDVRLQIAELWRSDQGPNGQSQARKQFRLLLKDNSELPAARVGQARTDLVFYNQTGAMKQLKRALVTNPNYVPALAVKAAIHVGNGDYKNADKTIASALKINPNHKETRAVKAALTYIRGDKAAYDAQVKALLELDPTYGHLHVICAELVGERQRRYDTAEMFARKAIEVEPRNRFAYTVLGESLMNTGQTDEALEVFNQGVKAAKGYKDVRRDNWREVLTDVIPRYRVLESEHFRVRIPLGDAKVTGPYLMELLEESWETLSKKYGMTPSIPIYVDAFDRMDDFSVRSVGSPGLPALGVCFGNVITILCPTARKVGEFSWSRTTWHEFAHVVTLQLSKGQVPRWLTEGLSVFEEEQRRERWGREMEKQLYDRWRNGRLLKMAEINSAFRGPDILFAYFQGGLISDHLMKDRGFDVIPKMLRQFAEDKTTRQVFKDVLGLELDTYDKQFHEYVGGIVGEYKMVPIWDEPSMKAFQERVSKDPQDVEAWIRIAWGRFQRRQAIDAGAALAKARAIEPTHPEVVLLLGALAAADQRADVAQKHFEAFLAMGEDDLRARLFLANRALTTGGSSQKVIEHLEAAKRCFPRYVAKDSPYLQLARLYRGGNQFEKAIGELEAFAAIAAENMEVRKELLAWYVQKKDWKQVARVCEEMVDITPFGTNVKRGEAPDMKMHRLYAEALINLGRPDAEILRELEVQVELGTLLDEQQQLDQGCVADRIALGRKYLDLGRSEDALDQALAALRLAPTDANARMLKQQAVEADGRR
ncbi:MAG: tetratricopeptide repeat protein [Planctomycetota bacterium]|nr:tetratricopeptide repeat protein [Planctomycetota bacterium]